VTPIPTAATVLVSSNSPAVTVAAALTTAIGIDLVTAKQPSPMATGKPTYKPFLSREP